MALLVLLLPTSGCLMSHLAADQIITAPNLHRGIQTNFIAAWWTNFFPWSASNPVVLMTIPVGPPEAKLQGFLLPPGDYHWKFETTFTTNRSGLESMLLRALRETNDTYRPLAHPATVILLHGYGMTKESMTPWALVLAQAGYRVVALDLRGHGMSKGTRIGFGKYEVGDLRQALDYLVEHDWCDGRAGVMGMSYGATMALHWAARDPRISTVVAIAPYNRPEETIVRFAEMLKLPVPKRSIRAGMTRVATMLDLEWKDWSTETAMRRLTQPVLIIGGGQDPICRREDIAALEDAATGAGVGPKILIIPEANHMVIGAWMQGLSEPVKEWFKAHLGAETAEGKERQIVEKSKAGQ